MNDLRIFENPQFGKVRTAGTTDNPLFCLADVCRVLELRVDGVTSRLKSDGVNRIGVIDSMGRQQMAIFVNEQNLYKVIMRSDKPQAEPFQDWVCGDVLPSIRKHGAYMTDDALQKAIQNPDFLIQLATELKNEKQKRLVAEKKIQETRPQVIFADAVTASSDSILVGELAKLINQNGTPMGEKRLFQWMRDNGYLGTKGERYNIPNQKYVDMGLFELKKGVRSGSNGVLHTTITTKVTGKGQIYFVNKFNTH